VKVTVEKISNQLYNQILLKKGPKEIQQSPPRMGLVFQFSKFFPKKSQEKFSGETACSKFWGARRSGKLLFGSYALGLST